MRVFSEQLNCFTDEDVRLSQENKDTGLISFLSLQVDRSLSMFQYYPWGQKQFKIILTYNASKQYGYYSLIPIFPLDNKFVEPEMFDGEGLASHRYKNIALNDFMEQVTFHARKATFDTTPSEVYPDDGELADLVMHFGNYTIRRTYKENDLTVTSTFQGDENEKRENLEGVTAAMKIIPVISAKGDSPKAKLRIVRNGSVGVYTRSLQIVR